MWHPWIWTHRLHLQTWERGIFSLCRLWGWNIHAPCVENEKTHGHFSWNASGTALPRGDGVFHSCELFSFQSGRKLFHICSSSKMFWLPKFFFCNSRADSILYSTCAVSLLPQRWKCQGTPPLIFHQNKSEQDLYTGKFSSWKGIEGPMDVRSWYDLKPEPLALSLVAGKFCQPAPWVLPS